MMDWRDLCSSGSGDDNMRKLVLFTTASVIASIMLIFSVPGEAKNRPNCAGCGAAVEYELCLAMGGDTNESASGGCSGAICYCCYDNGCFICGSGSADKTGMRDCTWDPKYSRRSIRQELLKHAPPVTVEQRRKPRLEVPTAPVQRQ